MCGRDVCVWSGYACVCVCMAGVHVCGWGACLVVVCVSRDVCVVRVCVEARGQLQ